MNPATTTQFAETSSAMDTTTHRVLEILAKQTEQSPGQLSEATTLEALGIDSLGMVEIIFDLEDEFDISIPESNDIQQRFKAFATVGDVVRLVESLLASSATK